MSRSERRVSFRKRLENAIRVAEDPALHQWSNPRDGTAWACAVCGKSIQQHRLGPVTVTFTFKLPGSADVVSAIQKAIEQKRDHHDGGRACTCACHQDARRHT